MIISHFYTYSMYLQSFEKNIFHSIINFFFLLIATSNGKYIAVYAKNKTKRLRFSFLCMFFPIWKKMQETIYVFQLLTLTNLANQFNLKFDCTTCRYENCIFDRVMRNEKITTSQVNTKLPFIVNYLKLTFMTPSHKRLANRTALED